MHHAKHSVYTAQVGSLVPAESAELHVLDAVHTRMGASDNLAMGSSTFLEASHILATFCQCASASFMVKNLCQHVGLQAAVCNHCSQLLLL